MTLRSVTIRMCRVRKFISEATSFGAMPTLFVTAVARDNPFGGGGLLSSGLGKIFGVIGVRTRSLGREFAWIDTHDLGQLISCEELLIEQTYNLSLVPFRPEVIMDCGAHVGLFSLIAGLRYASAELVAFEPCPANFRAAQRQLTRFASRLRLIEAAVSTENGEAWFCLAESNTGHLSGEPSENNFRVKTVDLADEVVRVGGKALLIKMDVEGAEWHVLPHVIRYLPKQCALFFETHGGERTWSVLSKLLSVAGFQVSHTRERGIFSDGFALRH